MAAFHLDQEFESINGGAARYDVSQMYPVSGNIASADVGTGAASGLTTFQWQDSTGWWSPQNSYFLLQLQFTAGGTNGIPGSLGTSPTNNVTYCDNFVHTLFTQIQSQIDSRPLDTVNTPHIIDTALTYSKAHNNFLKTWGSLTRVGEPLATRIKNVKVTSTANTLAGGGTNGLIDVVFRPPISLFDCKVLPPGAQFRVDFNWASSAILAFESVDGSIAIGNTAAQTPPIQYQRAGLLLLQGYAAAGVCYTHARPRNRRTMPRRVQPVLPQLNRHPATKHHPARDHQ